MEIWIEKSLRNWQHLQRYKSIIPQKIYKEWQMRLGENLVLVTASIIFSVVLNNKTGIGGTKCNL
jgi:hypothetical protein